MLIQSELLFIILSSLAFLQGVFLIIALVKRKKKANFFILAILFFALWLLLEFNFIRYKVNVNFNLLYSTRFGSWFLIGPLFYFYQAFLLGKKSFVKKDFFHFAPFLLFTLILPFFFVEPLSKNSIHYGMLTLFKYDFPQDTWIQEIYTYVFVIQFLHAIYYVVLSIYLQISEVKLFQNQRSDDISIQLRWLKVLSFVFIGILISTLIYYGTLLSDQSYRRHMDYVYMLPILVLIYTIAYKALRQPEIYHGEIRKEKYEQSNLSEAEILDIRSRLSSYMDDERAYRNPKLKIDDLASQLRIHSKQLSQVINSSFQMNFFDFVNTYRLEEAKKELIKNPQKTILEIAYQVGFNNKTSFNNFFKKKLALTPSAFRKKQELS